MKLANYRRGNEVRAGVVVGESLYDISELSHSLSSAKTVDRILEEGLVGKVAELVPSAETRPLNLSRLKFASPVLWPEKILLAAVNYRSHSAEDASDVPSQPHFFTKFRNSIVAHEEEILAPRISRQVDWEVELAVVIGREGKYIPRSRALEYVAGYTIAVDVSFRDLQFPSGRGKASERFGPDWVKGKGLDSSFPLGPWLVTSDELRDPGDLSISLRVNGEKRQDSRTSEMVFGVAELIESASSGITLRPGDIISTGTPAGVARFSGAPYLEEGDTVEASVEGIGTLRNRVKRER